MRCLSYAELEREHGVPNDAEFFGYDGHDGQCVAFFDGDVQWDGDLDEATVRRWLDEAGQSPLGSIILGVRGSLQVEGDLLAASSLGVAPPGNTNNVGFGLYVLGDVSANNMTLGSEHVSALVVGETRLRGGLFLAGNGTMMELRGAVHARFAVDPHSTPVLFDEDAVEHVIRDDEDVPPTLREETFEDGSFEPSLLFRQIRAATPTAAATSTTPAVALDPRRPANLLLEDAESALVRGSLDEAIASAEQVLEERPDDTRATTVLARALFASDPQRSAQLAAAATPRSERCAALAVLHALFAETSGGDGEAERLFIAGREAFEAFDHAVAAQAWLDSLVRTRALRDDGARRALVALFGWLGSDDPITEDYRRQLMFAL